MKSTGNLNFWQLGDEEYRQFEPYKVEENLQLVKRKKWKLFQ